MLIDIVVLPPEKLRRRIGERTKKSARGISAGFIVDNKKFIPHLSLWHINTSRERLKKIEVELAKLVKKSKTGFDKIIRTQFSQNERRRDSRYPGSDE